MRKKFILFLMFLSFQCSPAIASENFDPESTEFTKMETLKTWIASVYHDDVDICNKIQLYAGKEVPESPECSWFFFIEKFGRAFPTLEGSQLPFLQHVREIGEKKENPIVMEIGPADGRVTWKIPYALGEKGTVYANELDKQALSCLKKKIEERLLPVLRPHVTTIDINCLEIPSLAAYPEYLKEKVDCIYVQNVEHFFTPQQHECFLNLVSDLLAPDGRAYLIANTLDLNDLRRNDVWKEYTKGKIYPYYESIENGYETNFNYFTPEVYKNALEKFDKLELLESFLLDYKGKKQERVDLNSKFVVAIVQKKAIF